MHLDIIVIMQNTTYSDQLMHALPYLFVYFDSFLPWKLPYLIFEKQIFALYSFCRNMMKHNFVFKMLQPTHYDMSHLRESNRRPLYLKFSNWTHTCDLIDNLTIMCCLIFTVKIQRAKNIFLLLHWFFLHSTSQEIRFSW